MHGHTITMKIQLPGCVSLSGTCCSAAGGDDQEGNPPQLVYRKWCLLGQTSTADVTLLGECSLIPRLSVLDMFGRVGREGLRVPHVVWWHRDLVSTVTMPRTCTECCLLFVAIVTHELGNRGDGRPGRLTIREVAQS